VTDNNQLHVVFGTGPVGMAVMYELVSRGHGCEWSAVAVGRTCPRASRS
jgi:hypothetical protein